MTIQAVIEEFEERYAARSHTTVRALHRAGRFGALCDCEEDGCEGFQMLHLRDDLIDAGWVLQAEPSESGVLFPPNTKD